MISVKFLNDCLMGYLAESHWNLVTKFDKSSKKIEQTVTLKLHTPTDLDNMALAF